MGKSVGIPADFSLNRGKPPETGAVCHVQKGIRRRKKWNIRVPCTLKRMRL